MTAKVGGVGKLRSRARSDARTVATAQNDGLSRAEAAAVDPKRARIVAAATQVLRSKGYAAMTTLDVAQAAGISKRDLYGRFANKDALLAAIVTEGVQQMLEPVRLEPPHTRDAFYSGLQAFGAMFLNEMLAPTRLQLYRLAIGEVQQNPAIAHSLLTQGSQATAQVVGAYFGEAQARGVVKFQAVDAAVGAYFCMLMGDRIVTHLLDPDRRISPAEVARYVGLALLVVRALDEFRSAT